jgi:hypothetical protein
MALLHVNGLAAGSALELGFCAQGRHVLRRETWLTGGAATARSAARSCRGCAGRDLGQRLAGLVQRQLRLDLRAQRAGVDRVREGFMQPLALAVILNGSA